MRKDLERYRAGVQSPADTGYKHFETLLARDRLALVVEELSSEEKALLAAVDHQLLMEAIFFWVELRQLIDHSRSRKEELYSGILPSYRQTHKIDASRWWWYLDVLVAAPIPTRPPFR